MTRICLLLSAAVLLGLGGCAQHTGTLPGTACCGMECESCCWPTGRIGPVCPELCEEYAEPECPPCLPGNPRPYEGPVPGKHVS